ncbi:MAG: RNA-binding domain-containing protein [Thermocladium sp.]
MELLVKAIINPTEDPAKVKNAVHRMIDLDLRLVNEGGVDYVVGVGNSIMSLSPLRDLVNRLGMTRLMREILRSSVVGDTIEIKLHKQAAYVGAISFVTHDSESPMGPITITITASDPEKIIEWLAPHAPRGGKRLNGLHGK